ncbi:MAG: hypothetical protein IJX76_07610 [Clostridia bacterium]|nr:hypothetical protein [Clostridia bacterium]
MWNKIKAFFSGNPAPVEEGADHRHVDYTVQKNRKFDMIARILAVLAALLLWIYVVSTTTVSEEEDFSLVPVVCNGEESLRSEYGLVVQSMSIDTLNVRLMGNRQELRKVTNEQVKAYISLAGIDTAGEYELKVYVDVPSGITVVSQSVSQVVVQVDRTAQKQMSVTESNLSLQGWTLSEGCFFGETKLNIDTLTVEGPTLSLQKVASVELYSDVIGDADESFTVTATPHLLDSKGNIITDSSLSIRETGQIKISVEVLKSKTVPLTVQGKNGYLTADQYTLTPSTAVIVGEPKMVDATDALTVAVVDETDLAAKATVQFSLNITGLTVTDSQNAPLTTVQAQFDLSALPVHVVEEVPVFRGSEAVGSVKVTVRGVSTEVAAIVQALTSKDITVYSDTEQPEGTISAMTAVFTETLRAYVYAVEITDYDNTPPSKDVIGNLEHPVVPVEIVA